MFFIKKPIEIETLLTIKSPLLKKTPTISSIHNVKFKLINFAMEESQKNTEDATPTFFEEEAVSLINESLTEIEKRISIWLDDRNITSANPKEKIYAFFQKNRDKILFGQKKKNNIGQKLESKSFLDFNNSPLLMRREKKVVSSDAFIKN